MDIGAAQDMRLRAALPRPDRTPITVSRVGTRAAATRGHLRLLRSGVAGCCATGVALGGHVVGYGRLPAAGVLAATAAGVAVLSLGMSRWRWTFPRLLALLLVAQVPLHGTFTRTGHLPAAAHAEHAPAAVAPETALDQPMLLGHLLAAVLTAVLLQRGEAWLHAVLDTLGLRALRVFARTHPTCATPGNSFSRQDADLPCTNTATDAWLRRGPPR